MNAVSTFFQLCRPRQLQTATSSSSKLTIRSRSVITSRREYSSSSSRSTALETQSISSETTTIPPFSSAINTTPQTQTSSTLPSTDLLNTPTPPQSHPFSDLQKSSKPKKLPTDPPVTRTGTVTAAHLTPLTVRVRTTSLFFDKTLHTHWTLDNETLVHDPLGLLVEGDVIDFTRFSPEERARRVEKRIRANAISQGKVKVGEENEKKEGVAVVLKKKIKMKGRKGQGVGRIRGDGRGTVKWVLKQVVTPFGRSWDDRVTERERLDMETAAAAVEAVGDGTSITKGPRTKSVGGRKSAEEVAGGTPTAKGRKNVKNAAKGL